MILNDDDDDDDGAVAVLIMTILMNVVEHIVNEGSCQEIVENYVAILQFLNDEILQKTNL